MSSPSSRRFSVTKAMPRRMLSAAETQSQATPSTWICPRSKGSRPKRMRASSVRPEPMSPKSPSTSALCSVRSISLTIPGCDRPRTSRTISSAGVDARDGKIWLMSRPTMREIIVSTVKSSRGP